MKKCLWWYGGVLVLVVAVGVVFRQDFERLYNEFLFVDGFGKMLVDDYFSSPGSIMAFGCKSQNDADNLRVTRAGGNDRRSEKTTFFGYPQDVSFVNNSDHEQSGLVSYGSSQGQAFIRIDETCWDEESPSFMVFAYSTDRVFPSFTHFVFPTQELDGQFQIHLDIIKRGSHTSKALSVYLANSSSFGKDLAKVDRSKILKVYSTELNDVGATIINLGSDDDTSIDWNQASGLIITISGHGRLEFGSPYLLNRKMLF